MSWGLVLFLFLLHFNICWAVTTLKVNSSSGWFCLAWIFYHGDLSLCICWMISKFSFMFSALNLHLQQMISQISVPYPRDLFIGSGKNIGLFSLLICHFNACQPDFIFENPQKKKYVNPVYISVVYISLYQKDSELKRKKNNSWINLLWKELNPSLIFLYKWFLAFHQKNILPQQFTFFTQNLFRYWKNKSIFWINLLKNKNCSPLKHENSLSSKSFKSNSKAFLVLIKTWRLLTNTNSLHENLDEKRSFLSLKSYYFLQFV